MAQDTPKKFTEQFLFFSLITALILGIAVFLRIYDISLRPLHSDEGVNFHFLKAISTEGYYPYSHENYHGPAYFYASYLFTSLLSFSDLSLRGSSILFGFLTVLACLSFLKIESRVFVLFAMLFSACSSSLIFMSRYAIHETLFTLSGFLLALGVMIWHKTRLPHFHLLSGLGLGLLIATKETFIITLFCIFFAFFAMGDYRRVLQNLFQQKEDIFKGLLLAIVIVLVCFTGGLQWPGGLREMFLAVPQWISRNDSDVGHFKPFLYYTHIIFGRTTDGFHLSKILQTATEPQLYLALILPSLLGLCYPRSISRVFAKENAVGRFLFVWAVLSFLVYSFVSYKTPWLIINITLPAALFLAWIVYALCEMHREKVLLCSVLVVVASSAALRASYKYNFEYPYGKKNPFSYVHTHQGMLQLLSDIEKYAGSRKNKRILVATEHYWPLPYYLRDYKGAIGYQATEAVAQYADAYDILIMDSKVDWHNAGWVKKYYRLSDVQETNTYFRRSE